MIRTDIKRLNKKAMDPMQIVIYVGLIVIFLFVIIVIVFGVNKVISAKTISERCRMTVLENALFRHPDLTVRGFQTGEGMNQERKGIDCPSSPDLVLKYDAVKGSTGNLEAVKYNIMHVLAEEMRTCNYRYGGDVPNLVPFGSESGTYCGLCRSIKFDQQIQDKFGINKLTESNNKLDNFMTYLMVSKIPIMNMTYLKYLYGISGDGAKSYASLLASSALKNVNTAKDEKTLDMVNKFFSSTKDVDFAIDPSKQYYVMHYVVKGTDYLGNQISKALYDVQHPVKSYVDKLTSAERFEACYGFVKNKIIPENPDPIQPTDILDFQALIGRMMLRYGISMSCMSMTSNVEILQANTIGEFPWTFDKTQPFVRITMIVPADEYQKMSCMRTYGVNPVKEGTDG